MNATTLYSCNFPHSCWVAFSLYTLVCTNQLSCFVYYNTIRAKAPIVKNYILITQFCYRKFLKQTFSIRNLKQFSVFYLFIYLFFIPRIIFDESKSSIYTFYNLEKWWKKNRWMENTLAPAIPDCLQSCSPYLNSQFSFYMICNECDPFIRNFCIEL